MLERCVHKGSLFWNTVYLHNATTQCVQSKLLIDNLICTVLLASHPITYSVLTKLAAHSVAAAVVCHCCSVSWI